MVVAGGWPVAFDSDHRSVAVAAEVPPPETERRMLDGVFPLTDPGAVFALLFLLVLIGPMLAGKLRLPALVGLIVIGMVVGPNVLGVVASGSLINALGFVGLLYLMFQGGLDLDLDGFRARRRDSIIFGTLTFLVPILLVIGVAMWLGIPWWGAVILASALASHTPLSYPAISRYQLHRNPMVTASLGATLLTNVLALLVLAVAAAAADGSATVLEWVFFLTGLTAFVVLMLIGVPRLTRWFFRGLGQDRDVRLTYLLSGMGLAAVTAGVLGTEPIVGAFLAGLAFNRFVPDGTLIADRVDVLGRSLFVPAFLISTGMMLDPVALVSDFDTLQLGLWMVLALVVSKLFASEASGRILRASRPERGLMFSLSVGQAAGALAATVVGEELGVLGTAEVNAVVLVIMVSALLAGLTADRYAPKIQPPGLEGRSVGKRVIVPVSNPETTDALVRVAGQIAAPDSGAVVTVNILPFDADADQVREQRSLSSVAEKAALAAGAEVQPTVRVDSSTDNGVLHSIVERDGTSLVMGWKGYSSRREALFGSVIDRCIDISPVPVLICRPGVNEPTQRVLLVVTQSELSTVSRGGLAFAAEIAERLGSYDASPVVIITDIAEEDVRAKLGESVIPDHVEVADGVLSRLADTVTEGDVVVTVVPPTPSRLGRGARRVAEAARDRTVVVAVPR